MQYTVEELYNKKEGQTYDRKSARKDPKSLSNHIVAFANADGGTLVIGIEDDFTVSGIDDYHERVNDILRVPYDYCKPSVTVMTEFVDCDYHSAKCRTARQSAGRCVLSHGRQIAEAELR